MGIADLTPGAPGAPRVSDTPIEVPELEDATTAPGGAATVDSVLVTDENVRDFFEGVGILLNKFAPEEEPDLWRFDDDELELLAPAIVRISQRRPKLQAVLQKSDAGLVAAGFGLYAYRNIDALGDVRQARAALAAQAEADAIDDGQPEPPGGP